MFDELTTKMNAVFKKLRGHGKMTEANIRESLREVRRVLLEADVNFKVVKKFVAAVEERAIGQAVLDSVSPGQMVIKVVHDCLIELLGGTAEPLQVPTKKTATVMLVGLQGSGKTTHCGKLAKMLAKQNYRPVLVAADIYRPAAVKQLEVLGRNINIPVLAPQTGEKPPALAVRAKAWAEQNGYNPVIFDTAGRLHIDEEMMAEVEAVKAAVDPEEILLVLDGMTGQDAVNVADTFHKRLSVTGLILTKMDGDSKGGAAISIREVTGAPLKFIGTGEKLDALEVFYPDRMASRILGMGDIVSLVEKAQEAFEETEAIKMQEKLRKDQFTLQDYLDQLQKLKKMGPLGNLMKMIPGATQMGLTEEDMDEKQLVRVEAIINSMTPDERAHTHILNGSRRLRIAKGSGTSIQEVNRLLKEFEQLRGMIKQMTKKSRFLPKGLPFG